jgi:ring-1,2-phenylacetyl-CoA epoxidase subunit PaaC
VTLLEESLKKPFGELLLSVADDKLFLGHRNADWTGLAPVLEEDIAFSSIAQDELAHASAIYALAADILSTKADKLAYGRKPEEYRCAQIVELSDDFDWALAMMRSFFCDHFDRIRLERLARSSYKPLASLAGRLAAEEQIHVDHVDSWVPRLGRGTAEARGRLQAALDRLAPQAAMLWELLDGADKLKASGLLPGDEGEFFRDWQTRLQQVAGEAGLRLEVAPPPASARGGRRGRHSDAFVPMLDELTEVYRIEPEAAW